MRNEQLETGGRSRWTERPLNLILLLEFLLQFLSRKTIEQNRQERKLFLEEFLGRWSEAPKQAKQLPFYLEKFPPDIW